MISGYITRNKLILELASIARSKDATDADKYEARNMILLLVGAGAYFLDRHGHRITTIEETIRVKTSELGKDHSEVVRLRIDRDHQYMIEQLLGERESYELH